MRLTRLPFRVQVPIGLALAVLLTSVLMSAAFTATSARREQDLIVETVQRARSLLARQAQPMVLTDDVWGLYELLRETAQLIGRGHAESVRMAVLDQQAMVLASNVPRRWPLNEPFPIGSAQNGDTLLTLPLARPDTPLQWSEPINSDDGQVLGHLLVEVDPDIVTPDWPMALTLGCAVGATVMLILLPAGWWVGQRLTAPVVQIASCIESIGSGKTPAPDFCNRLPTTLSPELARIANAVLQLLAETQARQQAEERALSAERLAALGHLTAAVAHEINNPLAGLGTALKTLRMSSADEGQRERALAVMERGLQQLRTVVSALLPHARGDERALTLQDVHDVALLAHAAARRESVQCELTLPASSWSGRAPATAWRQVMLNLLLNALRAAAPDGKVRARLHAQDGRLIFEVANSGRRLDAQGLQRVLTAENGPDPRGYGLWICQQIALRHGGSLVSVVDDQDPTSRWWEDGWEPATHLRIWLPLQPERDGHATASN